MQTEAFKESYQILDTVGSGGMSVIYKARHITLNKIVAIKMLHSHLLNDVAIMRFQQEAQGASSLKHPNVIAVHDFGLTEEGQPFMVMDLIEGITLADLLEKRNSLPLPEAMDIFIGVADALEHAHAHGVLHRDLKPGNIMLTESDGGKYFVHLVDFGIAKVLDNGAAGVAQKLTQTGQLFGSPLYMSPEQCMGRPLDQRSDIYSLGCIMYECLVGWPPHSGDTMIETIFKHLNDSIVPINEARADINFPQSMVNLVGKTLANKPEDRCQAVSAVKHALIEIQSGSFKSDILQTKLRAPKALSKPNILLICHAVLAITWIAVTWALLHQPQDVLSPLPPSTRPAQVKIPFSALRLDDASLKFFDLSTGLDDSGLLNLANSGIHNRSLAYIAQTPGLHGINLDNTDVTDFTALAGHPQLTMLSLANNKANPGELKVAAKIQSLSNLCLTGSRADDDTLQVLGSSTAHLQRLELQCTAVTDVGVNYLSNLKDLTWWKLSGSQIGDQGIRAIAASGLIKNLQIADTNVGPDCITLLRHCPDLGVLVLGGTRLSQASFKALADFKKLYSLTMSHIPTLNDADLQFVSTGIRKLTVADCPLTDGSAQYINKMTKLEFLSLKQIKISDQFFKHIDQLQNLNGIEIVDAPISNEGLQALSRLSALKAITLDGSLITDSGLKSLYGKKNLRSIAILRSKAITTNGIMDLKHELPLVSINADRLY